MESVQMRPFETRQKILQMISLITAVRVVTVISGFNFSSIWKLDTNLLLASANQPLSGLVWNPSMLQLLFSSSVQHSQN